MAKKYLIVIEQIQRDYHEIELEGDSIMEAFDQAREMVEKRNKTNKCKCFVTKIKDKENE